MVDRKPGVHFPSLHSLPWFHSGTVPVYQYRATDSGLTPANRPIKIRSKHSDTKLQPLKEYTNVDEQVPMKPSFSEFPELKHLPERCMLLTIEHCDRCEEHCHNTRHDPEKYAYFAQSLKTACLVRFPVVRVLIKPRSSSPDALRRLGAFEVQLFCKDGRDATKIVLHSKLATLKWPDINEVMEKLAQHMPRSNLFVTLYDSLATNVVLKGLRVKLKPKTVTMLQRPSSASASSLKLTSRSSRAKTARPPSALVQGPNKTTIIPERMTNETGSCYFEKIPKDMYEVYVVESSEYSASVKSVNLFDEDAASVNLYIPVVNKKVSCFNVMIRDAESKHEIAGAVASLRSASSEHALNEVAKGLYQISIPFGDYILAVEHRGYTALNRKVSLSQQNIELREFLKPEKKRYIEVYAVDAISGEPLSVVVQLKVKGSKHVYEGMTEEGKFKFQIDQVAQMTYKVSKKGFLDFKRRVNTTAGDCAFLLPLLRANFSPLTLVVFKDPNEEAQLVLRDTTEVLNSNDKFAVFGVAVVTCSSKYQWVRVGVDFTHHNSIAALLYSDQMLLAEYTPPKAAGYHWDVMALSRSQYIAVGVVTSTAPLTCKQHLKDFAQMGQLVIKAKSSIEEIFGFNSTETPITRKGTEAFIHPLILQQLFESEVSSDSVNYLCRGLDAGDGVSLSSLKQCFEGNNFKAQPFNLIPVEEIMTDLGLKLPEDAEFLYLAEEILDVPLPQEWEYRFDGDSWVYFNNSTEQFSDQHPDIIRYTEKILKEKQSKFQHILPTQDEDVQGEPDLIEEVKELVEGTEEVRSPTREIVSPTFTESLTDSVLEDRFKDHIKDLVHRADKWVISMQAKHSKSETDKAELLKAISEAQEVAPSLENGKKLMKKLSKAEKKLLLIDSSSSSDSD